MKTQNKSLKQNTLTMKNGFRHTSIVSPDFDFGCKNKQVQKLRHLE